MSKTVLVIEDDKSVVRLLVDVLEGAGFKVLVEHDGEWGLRTFQDKPIDLAIVDVLIPKLKGFDLINRLRETEKGRSTPIIVMSGVYRAATHGARLSSEKGVLAYLDKPVDIERLLEIVKHGLLGRSPSGTRSRSGPSLSGAAAPSGLDSVQRGESSASSQVDTGLPLSLPVEGRLEIVPFARLLGSLYASRASGSLLLRRATAKKVIHLRHGIPLFVQSNVVGECLGRILVAERLISEEECARSLERKAAIGRLQGELLVEMGALSPHNLEFALELQMQTKLYDLFSWLDGEYHFIANDEFAGHQVALALSPPALIYEGASRAMSMDRVERDFASMRRAYVLPAPDPTVRYQALEVEPRAGKLFEAMDGTKTIDALLRGADFDPADAMRLVYAFASSGLLRLGAVPFDEGALSGNITAGRTAPPRALSRIPTDRGAGAAPRNDSEIPVSVDDSDFQALPVPSTLSSSEPQLGLTAGASGPGERERERTAPIEADDIVSEVPALSDSIRRRVRARLDAESEKLMHGRVSGRPARAPQPPDRKSRRIEVERDDARKIDELEARLEALNGLDAYAVLELTPKATASEIRAAHERLKRENHPDRLVSRSASRPLRALAERIFLVYERAFEALFDDDVRHDYDRRMGLSDPDARIASIILAEHAFLRGKEALEAEDLARAVTALRVAAERCPDEGTYLAYLAFAVFSEAPRGEDAKSKALADLERAEGLAPELEETFLFRGKIHQRTGDRMAAIRAFEQAVKRNPDSLVALQALRALEPPSQKKGSLLSRLTR